MKTLSDWNAKPTTLYQAKLKLEFGSIAEGLLAYNPHVGAVCMLSPKDNEWQGGMRFWETKYFTDHVDVLELEEVVYTLDGSNPAPSTTTGRWVMYHAPISGTTAAVFYGYYYNKNCVGEAAWTVSIDLAYVHTTKEDAITAISAERERYASVAEHYTWGVQDLVTGEKVEI